MVEWGKLIVFIAILALVVAVVEKSPGAAKFPSHCNDKPTQSNCYCNPLTEVRVGGFNSTTQCVAKPTR